MGSRGAGDSPESKEGAPWSMVQAGMNGWPEKIPKDWVEHLYCQEWGVAFLINMEKSDLSLAQCIWDCAGTPPPCQCPSQRRSPKFNHQQHHLVMRKIPRARKFSISWEGPILQLSRYHEPGSIHVTFKLVCLQFINLHCI